MSLAVLGTDTGVGKTVVSALLLARYGDGRQLGYWKPVATGAREERDTATVGALVERPFAVHPEGYLLPEPLSPHLAARLAGARIEIEPMVATWRAIAGERSWVVEGAGGVLVPLDDDGTLLVDLVARLALPALVVARSTLGTLNHTLLTIEALRRRDVAVAGVVMVGPPNRENRVAIERFGRVTVVAEVPPLDRVDRAAIRALAADFDAAGALADLLAWSSQEIG